MPPAKVATLQAESTIATDTALPAGTVDPRLKTSTTSPNVRFGTTTLLKANNLSPSNSRTGSSFQTRTPPITGEATFHGALSVDGVISGQLTANGNGLTVRQRSTSHSESQAELNGEIRFKDLLRINGHVAGHIVSEKGTLIIATEARVDADIVVAAAVISGRVNGKVVGHQRVELCAGAVVTGKIATHSLAIRPGAIFDGDCQVLGKIEEM